MQIHFILLFLGIRAILKHKSKRLFLRRTVPKRKQPIYLQEFIARFVKVTFFPRHTVFFGFYNISKRKLEKVKILRASIWLRGQIPSFLKPMLGIVWREQVSAHTAPEDPPMLSSMISASDTRAW